MRKIFAPDAPLMQFMANAGTLVWINLLWLICCIPIVTIGASTAALYRMVFNMREYKACRTSDFFKAFASNFKNGTIIWLLALVGAACLYLLYSAIGFYEARMVQLALLAGFFCFLMLGLAVLTYAFPLTCYFENSVRGTLSNALILSLSRPLRTVGAVALGLVPLLVLLFMTQFFLTLLMVFIFIMPAVLAYYIAGIVRPVFEPYIPKEELPEIDRE